MLTTAWQKAPCTQTGCLEAKLNPAGGVELRSTTTGQQITLLSTEWATFLDGARAGLFDLPGGER